MTAISPNVTPLNPDPELINLNSAGLALYDLLLSHGLTQLINKPTRITETSKSLIDLFITDSPTLTMNHDVLSPIANSDHRAIFANLSFFIPKSKPTRIIHYLYENINLENVAATLMGAAVNTLFDLYDDINVIFSSWSDLFNATVKKKFPTKTIIHKNTKPYYNSELHRLHLKKDRIYDRSSRLGTGEAYLLYSQVRAEYLNKLEAASDKYNNDLATKLINGKVSEIIKRGNNLRKC